MTLSPGDPCFIGEVAADLTRQARADFTRTCRVKRPGPVFAWWAKAALSWAGVLNADGKWDLNQFKPIYRARIDAGWALEIIVCACSSRFVLTPRRVMSLPEFEWLYGMDVIKHLLDQQKERTAVLTSAIEHLQSRVQKIPVILADMAGNEIVHELPVLACQKIDDWTIPSGYRLVEPVDK